MSKDALPTYRLHKPSGQAIVTLNGRTLYLGKHGTPESRQAYDRTIAEWLANGRRLPRLEKQKAMTVAELVAAFRDHAETYYRGRDGKVTSEVDSYRQALRIVRRLYGSTPAEDFGPRALRAVREMMIEAGWARTHINKQVHRVACVFKWAASQELVPIEVYHGLKALPGLRKGRTRARESEPVRPVPDELVDAVQPFVSRQVWAVIQLQRLTGARAGELVIMRPTDVDTSGQVWLYTPTEHKTAHHGHERTIYLGPQAQEVLQPFLLRSPESHCFSPIEAERERYRKLVAERNSPKRRKKRSSRKDLRDHYTRDSYRRAITRSLRKAFPPPGRLAQQPDETRKQHQARLTDEDREAIKVWQREHHWHPHQLRHNYATNVRQEFGLEAAQVLLGHTKADVTQIYAERDMDRAATVAAKIG